VSTTLPVLSKPVAQQFPFLDLKAQFNPLREEIVAAINRVLESQIFILGAEVENFETEVAQFIGAKYAIGCASGSDALLLAMMALGIAPGDEVITVPFTFVATAGAIARLHAKPVFIDIDPHTFNLDPAKLQAAITSHTKAIIPVHLFGLAADMDSIMTVANANGIPVIEDAAQAIGAQFRGKNVGTFGAFGCFSFFPSKNLGAAGDGGLICTNDEALQKKLRLMRAHGSRTKYDYEVIGMNSRLDALQAAILRVKLSYLSNWTDGRRRNAERYRMLFSEYGVSRELTLPGEPPDRLHIYNQFTVRTTRRDALKQYLADVGIPSEIYYPYPLHTQPAFTYLDYTTGEFPQSEAASQQVLSLPIFPELTKAQQRAVVNAIAAFYREN